MKPTTRHLLFATALLAPVALFAATPVLQTTRPLAPGALAPQVQSPKIRPVTGCPDPAVQRVWVDRVAKLPDGRYNFTVRADVRNAGRAAYRSKAGQQRVTLYQGPRPYMFSHFTNLAPGQAVAFQQRVSFVPGGEFLADYRVVIEYDPDIRIDGNKENDDCRMNNNSMTLRRDTIQAALDNPDPVPVTTIRQSLPAPRR